MSTTATIYKVTKYKTQIKEVLRQKLLVKIKLFKGYF